MEYTFVDLTRKVFIYVNFSYVSYKQEMCILQVTFSEKPQMEINSLKKQKLG